jgi:hypothetical protein
MSAAAPPLPNENPPIPAALCRNSGMFCSACDEKEVGKLVHIEKYSATLNQIINKMIIGR